MIENFDQQKNSTKWENCFCTRFSIVSAYVFITKSFGTKNHTYSHFWGGICIPSPRKKPISPRTKKPARWARSSGTQWRPVPLQRLPTLPGFLAPNSRWGNANCQTGATIPKLPYIYGESGVWCQIHHISYSKIWHSHSAVVVLSIRTKAYSCPRN